MDFSTKAVLKHLNIKKCLKSISPRFRAKKSPLAEIKNVFENRKKSATKCKKFLELPEKEVIEPELNDISTDELFHFHPNEWPVEQIWEDGNVMDDLVWDRLLEDCKLDNDDELEKPKFHDETISMDESWLRDSGIGMGMDDSDLNISLEVPLPKYELSPIPF